jgi:hypothetical protein
MNKMTLYFCYVTDVCVGLQYGQGVKTCCGNPVENGMQAFFGGASKHASTGYYCEVPENIYPLGMTAEQLAPYGS